MLATRFVSELIRRDVAQVHAVEARVTHLAAIDCRDRIHRGHENPELRRVEEMHDVGVAADDIHDEVAVAHPGQGLALLRGVEPGQVVLLLLVQANGVELNLGTDRRLADEIADRHVSIADDELVFAESLAVVEHAAFEAHVAVVRPHAGVLLEVAFAVDAQLPEQTGRDRAVLGRRLDVQRAAIDQVHTTLVPELVTLCVAAEVVVVVEDQDARVGPVLLPEKIGRREAAQSAAHDNQVIGAVAGIHGAERRAVARGVGHFE